jgi:hypothetical protein
MLDDGGIGISPDCNTYRSIVLNMITSKRRTYALANHMQIRHMKATDFKQYRAIVFADPVLCDPNLLADPLQNSAEWSQAIDGNVVVIGATEVLSAYYIYGGPSFLVSNMLDFVASRPGTTGLYFSLGCYYQNATLPTPVKVLENIGSFKVMSPSAISGSCADDCHTVVTHPVTDGITDADLSNWTCSAKEVFASYPSTFKPVAIARNFGNMSFPDGSVGTPYILVRGPRLVLPDVADYLLYDFGAASEWKTVLPDMIRNKSRTYSWATAHQLVSMTTEDFKKYRAIVFGDPVFGCDPSLLSGAVARSRDAWSAAAEGNVIVMGTTEIYNSPDEPGARTLVSNALDFVAKEGSTGLYISLSCFYGDASSSTPVPILDRFGSFEVMAPYRASPSCIDNVRIVAPHPMFGTLTDAALSNWGFYGCSVSEVFTTYPPWFVPFAVANTGAMAFGSGSVEAPYILLRDRTPMPAPPRCRAVGGRCSRPGQCCSPANKACDGPVAGGRKTCKVCARRRGKCTRTSQCCRGLTCRSGACRA